MRHLVTLNIDDGVTARELLLAAVLVFVAVSLTVGMATWAILKAGHFPSPMSLVVSLALLSMLALVAYAFTQDESLLTITATGVGALAGAVSQQYRGPRSDKSDTET